MNTQTDLITTKISAACAMSETFLASPAFLASARSNRAWSTFVARRQKLSGEAVQHAHAIMVEAMALLGGVPEVGAEEHRRERDRHKCGAQWEPHSDAGGRGVDQEGIRPGSNALGH